jgi:hypothetical protein
MTVFFIPYLQDRESTAGYQNEPDPCQSLGSDIYCHRRIFKIALSAALSRNRKIRQTSALFENRAILHRAHVDIVHVTRSLPGRVVDLRPTPNDQSGATGHLVPIKPVCVVAGARRNIAGKNIASIGLAIKCFSPRDR